MSFFEIYALFLFPILVAVVGAGIGLAYVWRLKRHDRQHPAE